LAGVATVVGNVRILAVEFMIVWTITEIDARIVVVVIRFGIESKIKIVVASRGSWAHRWRLSCDAHGGTTIREIYSELCSFTFLEDTTNAKEIVVREDAVKTRRLDAVGVINIERVSTSFKNAPCHSEESVREYAFIK